MEFGFYWLSYKCAASPYHRLKQVLQQIHNTSNKLYYARDNSLFSDYDTCEVARWPADRSALHSLFCAGKISNSVSLHRVSCASDFSTILTLGWMRYSLRNSTCRHWLRVNCASLYQFRVCCHLTVPRFSKSRNTEEMRVDDWDART